jgi:hypothetical protein
MLAATAPSPVRAAGPVSCMRGDIVLWGDGEHDDTAALNAWFRGEEIAWAQTGEPVGAAIAGRTFRLSAAVYVSGGSGRRLERFRMIWLERGEAVAGGTILSGNDPDAAPVVSGVSITGGDPGEGVPFDMPDRGPPDPGNPGSCAVS